MSSLKAREHGAFEGTTAAILRGSILANSIWWFFERERCRTDGGMIGRETVQSEQLLLTRAKHAPAPRLTSAAGEGVMAIHTKVPAIQRRGKKARRAMPRGRIG